jgi:hypothetical protein
MTLAGRILLYKADVKRAEAESSPVPQTRKQLFDMLFLALRCFVWVTELDFGGQVALRYACSRTNPT